MSDDKRPTAFEIATRATEAAEARARDLANVPSRRATRDDDIDEIAELQLDAIGAEASRILMADDDDENESADEDEDAQLHAMDAAAAFARAVERQAYDLRVREAARAKVAAENTPEAPPFDAGMLSEVLARPVEPAHRAEGLAPADAGILVVAQRKTGKTTLELNYARSLLLGGDFLGRFPVRPLTGRVAYLNFEVSAAQLARWAHEAGVPADRFYQVNLRGRRNPFAHEEDRASLAERLRSLDVEALIVDPFGRAFVGKSQNDAGEVGAWLADLDRFARGDCGIRDVVLSAHAGWDGERTRGASALEDWADVVVTLVRDRDDEQVRYLRAEGRDVLVDEDRLDYDTATRLLQMAGAGSRKQTAKTRHLDELVPAVVEAVRANLGVSGYGLAKTLRENGVPVQKKGDESKAAMLAVERGFLRFEHGPRNAKLYFLASPPAPPDDLPHGMSSHLPHLPYRGGGDVEVGQNTSPPATLNLAHLPGRCVECSFHVATQGHRAGCSASHERTTR